MITEGKVLLRALDVSDAQHYYAWINDPETNLWRGLYHPTSIDEAQRWLLNHQIPNSSCLTFAIINKTTNDQSPIGFIGLRDICNRSRRSEIWVYVGDKSSWGKGFGSAAMGCLIKYAFLEMNLNRIWLECDPEHKAAIRCYEKVGFIQEGMLRQSYYRRGCYRNSAIMAILREELKNI